MTFLNPAALFALAALAVLALLHLFRLRPVRRVMPSLRLWHRIPDRRPPVRSLRRPRWSLLLLLQMLTLAALVLAWAEPALVSEGPAPRDVAIFFDTSASMAPRMDRAKERALEVLASLNESDRVAVYSALPAPMVHRGDPREGIRRVGATHLELDVSRALSAVPEKLVYVLTDEPVPGAGVVGTGKRANTGIVDAKLEKDALFVRLAHVGPPAQRSLTVERKGAEVHRREFRIDESGLALSLPLGDAVRLDPDEFPLDDAVEAARGGALDVVLEGERDPRILKALSSQPDVRLAGEGEVCFHVRKVPAPVSGFSVVVDPPSGFAGVQVGDPFVPGELSFSDHPLLRSVEASEMVLSSAREIRMEGDVVVSAGGKPVVVAGPNLIVVGLEWRADGWPVHPSFPIFWTNVLRYARSSVPGGSRFLRTSDVPGGRVGERGDGFLNLLSERETRAPGIPEAPVDPPPEPDRRPVERPFGGVFLAAALVFLIAAWVASRE